MKKASLGDVQASLGEYVKTSVKQPVLILRGGEPVAMLIGFERRKKGVATKLRDVLKRAWKDYVKRGGIPHDEFWAELGKERC
jgi:hypothetical protein